MGAKSRVNWLIGTCIKSCANKYSLCDSCVRFSNLSDIPTDAISNTPIHNSLRNSPVVMQGDVVNPNGDRINLSTYQRNELYRKARDLKNQIEDSLCTKTETRIPNDRNVQKMLHSEFKVSPKIEEFKKTMRAIGADPKDYNVERLRR